MNYSEALEQQVRLWNWVVTDEAYRVLSAIVANAEAESRDGAHVRTYRGDDAAAALAAAVRTGLAVAEPFFWSPEMCRTLTTVASNVPDASWAEDLAPVRHGWCWFATPLPLTPYHGERADLRALGWSTNWSAQAQAPGLQLVAYLQYEDIATPPIPFAAVAWDQGQMLSAAVARMRANEPVLDQRVGEAARYGLAAFSLLAQRVFVTPHQRAERHAAKRVAREGWTHEPLIRVVQLRRTERAGYQPHDTAEHRDYSCQWVVRGHWRQQACGEGRKEHRPIWITPYVKGPEDKPLKAPRATVFAVTR